MTRNWVKVSPDIEDVIRSIWSSEWLAHSLETFPELRIYRPAMIVAELGQLREN
jgi:hypothetical protein